MTRFYIASDYELMIDIFKGEINFLKSSWQNMLGRPLVVMPLKNIHLGTVCPLFMRDMHIKCCYCFVFYFFLIFFTLPLYKLKLSFHAEAFILLEIFFYLHLFSFTSLCQGMKTN